LRRAEQDRQACEKTGERTLHALRRKAQAKKRPDEEYLGCLAMKTKTREVLRYLAERHKIGWMISLPDEMLKSLFTPEEFGEAAAELCELNVLILSVGNMDVETKRGFCEIGGDITDDAFWEDLKRSFFAQGMANRMRDKIKRMHSKMPTSSRKYLFNLARITPRKEWKKEASTGATIKNVGANKRISTVPSKKRRCDQLRGMK
jgi:hypothetical protein